MLVQNIVLLTLLPVHIVSGPKYCSFALLYFCTFTFYQEARCNIYMHPALGQNISLLDFYQTNIHASVFPHTSALDQDVALMHTALG